jgi:hypothetical protein
MLKINFKKKKKNYFNILKKIKERNQTYSINAKLQTAYDPTPLKLMGSTTKENIVGFVHGAQFYKKLGPAEIEREGTVH